MRSVLSVFLVLANEFDQIGVRQQLGFFPWPSTATIGFYSFLPTTA